MKMLLALQWFEQTDLYWEDISTIKKCLLVLSFRSNSLAERAKPLSAKPTKMTWKILACHIFHSMSMFIFYFVLFCFINMQEERYILFKWLNEGQEAKMSEEQMDNPKEKCRVGENQNFLFEMMIITCHSIYQSSEYWEWGFESMWKLLFGRNPTDNF